MALSRSGTEALSRPPGNPAEQDPIVGSLRAQGNLDVTANGDVCAGALVTELLAEERAVFSGRREMGAAEPRPVARMIGPRLEPRAATAAA